MFRSAVSISSRRGLLSLRRSALAPTNLRPLCINTPASSGSSSSTALAEEVLKNEKGEVRLP